MDARRLHTDHKNILLYYKYITVLRLLRQTDDIIALRPMHSGKVNWTEQTDVQLSYVQFSAVFWA